MFGDFFSKNCTSSCGVFIPHPLRMSAIGEDMCYVSKALRAGDHVNLFHVMSICRKNLTPNRTRCQNVDVGADRRLTVPQSRTDRCDASTEASVGSWVWSTRSDEPSYYSRDVLHFTSYLGDKCVGTPFAVTLVESDDCSPVACSSRSNDSRTGMVSVECSTNYVQIMRDKFGSSPYILEFIYGDEDCTKLSVGFGYPASGTCVGGYNETGGYIVYYVIANLNEDGFASLQFYPDRACLSSNLAMVESGDQTAVRSHSCDDNGIKWYSSNDVENDTGSSSNLADDSASDFSASDVVWVALGGLALVLTILVAFFIRRRSQSRKKLEPTKETASLETAMRGQAGLWSDDVITARRVPRDKVLTEKLISQGSFGEVYIGFYNGQQVAVKMLLPTKRTNLHHVNEFLAEAKMNAAMDHPHIVSFVGVAWDSLADICVVLEFMDGGELRTLLNRFEQENHPVGLSKQKIVLALQVCQALTYLHSLMPKVIHRDLKSRNILLNSEMDAKLSDFGISRERLDRTMTACVGTSLWMAPEVMLGERYDEKADMFSFGVVLSELDVHTLPYARFKTANLDSQGHEMTDSVLLQQIALGTVAVDFSETSPVSVVELGRSCMSIDPTRRPRAPEALYKLHVVLKQIV